MRKLWQILEQALPEAIGGVLATTAVALLVYGYRRGLRKLVPRRFRRGAADPPPAPAEADPGLVARFRLSRDQLTARIHDQYVLPLTDEIRSAFSDINRLRREQGLREHFALGRYRLVRPPVVRHGRLELDLLPMNFIHFVVLTDQRSTPAARQAVERMLLDVEDRLPGRLRSRDPVFNARSCIPLGVEIVLVTRDGKTLLRRRGRSVLTASGRWDVSVSGYCGDVDREGAEIDLGRTVEHEARRELGLLVGDPRDIRFTGLYHNRASSAIDVLGYWRLEMTSDHLIELLTEDSPDACEVFATDKRAEEPFVWDVANLIVDLDRSAVARVLARPELSSLIGEARASLMLALDGLEAR